MCPEGRDREYFHRQHQRNSRRGQIILSATPFNVPEAKGRKAAGVTNDFAVAPGGATVSITLPLGTNALLWDEFIRRSTAWR